MNEEVKINPKFPYTLEKAHRYLMFLALQRILTVEEYDECMKRLEERKRECSLQLHNGVS